MGPDQKGRSGCTAYRPISGIVQLSGMGKYPSPTMGTSPDAQKHMSGGKWARVLKCLPGQTGSSLDPHLFLDRVASKAALETGFDVPALRLIGGWKFVGCYQTYSQTCMAAVCTWVRTLGRFTTFDGLSEAVIFHTRRNIEVSLITIYIGIP